MDQLRVSGNVREELAQLPGPVLRPPRPGQAAPPDAEAVEAHSGPPAYRLPVVGKVVTGLGELSESGVRARGLTILAQPLAQVVAPTRGRVAFAGEYRGYGRRSEEHTSEIQSLMRIPYDVFCLTKKNNNK